MAEEIGYVSSKFFSLSQDSSTHRVSIEVHSSEIYVRTELHLPPLHTIRVYLYNTVTITLNTLLIDVYPPLNVTCIFNVWKS
jgi:hypothetical protein